MRAVLVVLDLVLFTVYSDSTGTRSKKHLTFAGRSDSATDRNWLGRDRIPEEFLVILSLYTYGHECAKV